MCDETQVMETFLHPCFLLIKAFKEADPVVRWLNKQQRANGGYGSTQVTQSSLAFSLSLSVSVLVLHVGLRRSPVERFSSQATLTVYQAVAEYWASDKDSDYHLNVDVLLPGRSKPEKYNFNRENHYVTRTSKVREHTHTHTFTRM